MCVRALNSLGWAAAGLLFVSTACVSVGSEKSQRVLLVTEDGAITIELYTEAAPVSAGDFLRYLDAGLLQESVFYRVVRPDNDHGHPKISVIQGGLPDTKDALTPIRHETTRQTGLTHIDGAVSLARLEPGTGGASTFFICVGDNPGLDFGGARNPDLQGFAVFGQVIDGMEVVRKIQAMPSERESEEPYTQGQLLTVPVRILSARRL